VVRLVALEMEWKHALHWDR